MERNKRLYNIWACMKQRCNNPNHTAAPWYHDKGIRVCEQWETDFNCFQKWAFENGYFEGGSIDRIDPLKGYNPENCRWITLDENRRRANRKGKKSERRATQTDRTNEPRRTQVTVCHSTGLNPKDLRGRDFLFIKAIASSYMAGKEAGIREAKAEHHPG